MTICPNVQAGMIGDLRALRHAKLSTANITDPQLRKEVKTDFRQIIMGDGAEKTKAAEDLPNQATKGKPEAEKVYLTVKDLGNRDETRLNGTLKMTEARMDTERVGDFIGPTTDPTGGKSELQGRVLDAVRLAEKSDYWGNMSGGLGKPDRAEAAWVNKQGAILLNQLDEPKEAQFREMAGRYYEADDAERSQIQYPFQPLLPRWKETTISDITSMSAPTDEASMRIDTKQERDLRKFEAENGKPEYKIKDFGEDPQKRQYNGSKIEMDKNGKFKQMPEQQFQIKGSLRGTGETSVTTYKHFDENGREVDKGRPYYSSQIQTTNAPFTGPELNQQGTERAFGISGAVGLIKEFNKWGTFLGDLNNTTANKIAKRTELEEGAKIATHFPVPPKLEDLPKFRTEYETRFGKAKADEMMHRLEELSHAFWNQ